MTTICIFYAIVAIALMYYQDESWHRCLTVFEQNLVKALCYVIFMGMLLIVLFVK